MPATAVPPALRAGLAILLSLTVVLAASPPAPANASGWVHTVHSYDRFDGTAISDPVDLGPGSATADMSSGLPRSAGTGVTGPLPSVYVGANAGGDVNFRMRLAADPRGAGFLDGDFYVAQVATWSGTAWVHRLSVGVNGKETAGSGDFVYVAAPATANNPHVVDRWNGSMRNARVVQAGNPDAPNEHFLDWWVPISAMQLVDPTITAETPVRLFFGTSAANNLTVINKDWMVGSTQDFSVGRTITLGPATLDLTRELSVVSGPTPPKVGRTTTYEVRYTVANTGLNPLTTNTQVTSPIPESATVIHVDASTGTFARDGDATTWSVGELRSGRAATITFRFDLDPAGGDEGGAVVLDHPTATGTDGGTGESRTATAAAISSEPIDPADPEPSYRVTATPATVEAGGPVSVHAQYLDVDGEPHPAGGHHVSWSSSNGGSFSEDQSTTAEDGLAAVTFTASTAAGTVHRITALDDTGATGRSDYVIVVAGTAARYDVSLSRATAEAGKSVEVAAQLTDAHGNPVGEAGREITWTATGGGTFEPTTVTTDGDGRGVTTFTTPPAGGTGHTITATDGAGLTGEAGPLQVAPAPAGYEVTVPSATPAAGEPFTVTAQLLDGQGAPLRLEARAVTWSDAGGGAFSDAVTATDHDGVATVELTPSTVAGHVHRVTAEDHEVSGTSVDMAVVAGAPHRYEVTGSGTLAAGAGGTYTASALDEHGNVVELPGTVTWSVTGGGTLGADTTTMDEGVATNTLTAASAAGTVHVLSVGDGQASGDLTVTVVAGAAHAYVVTPSTRDAQAGETIIVQAGLVDAHGNPVADAGRVVTWTASGGGAFASPSTATSQAGVATVSFTVSGTGGLVHRITATDGLSVAGTSRGVRVQAAPAPQPTPSPKPKPTPNPDPVPAPRPVPDPVSRPAPAPAPEPVVERVHGRERTTTAAALSRRTFPDGAQVVYVARADLFPDALVGGPLAARDGGPVLLVDRDGVPSATAEEIARLAPARVVIIGGTAAVSERVAGLLGRLAGDVSRLPGGDRYGTAALASASAYPAGSRTVFLVTGENFPDALTAGAAAAAAQAPVLLTTRSSLPPSTAAELARLAPGRIVIVGGEAAVSGAVERAAGRYAASVDRIAKGDRYATAAAVAAEFFPGTGGSAFVATGTTFADALTAAPAMGMARAPLLLSAPDALPEATRAELCRMGPRHVTVVGGVAAVDDRVMTAVARCLAP